MLRKIKNTWPYLKRLRDPRVLGQAVFAVIVVLVSWSGVKAIQTNYELQKEVSNLQQENDVQQLQNTNLKLKNQYFNTDRFLELAARRQFGRGASGETLLLVPKSVALAHTVDTPNEQQQTTQPQIHKSRGQRNFEAWLDFFFHRSST